MQVMGWLLNESDQCACCAPMHTRDKMREKLLWLWFPLWNVLLCWMSGCLLWLIMLPFTSPSAPSLPRGGHALKYDKLGGLWHAGIVTGCLAVSLLSSSPYSTLSIMKHGVWSFPSSVYLPCRQTHVNTRSTCWDQTCWTSRRESLMGPPSNSLGNTLRMLLNFSTEQTCSSCGFSKD